MLCVNIYILLSILFFVLVGPLSRAHFFCTLTSDLSTLAYRASSRRRPAATCPRGGLPIGRAPAAPQLERARAV